MATQDDRRHRLGPLPARALALLSGSSVEALRAATVGEDTAALARLPGIRRRPAAQLGLDLKDRVGPVAVEVGADGEVLAWLTAVGSTAAEAQAAVAEPPATPRSRWRNGCATR